MKKKKSLETKVNEKIRKLVKALRKMSKGKR